VEAYPATCLKRSKAETQVTEHQEGKKNMIIRRKRIQQLVAGLLREAGVDQPPVPIERIVKLQDLEVRKQEIPASDISGFLFRQGREAIIGVNAHHSSSRQRFTIAHELGHILLHAPGPNEFHVDRGFEVKFRNYRSSKGTDLEEREANLFAAELLMPQSFLAKDIATAGGVDLVDDRFIKKLAGRYRVSTQALLFRLANLGYVRL
jgi:Zn-dependent peptidase ImmA (M78 family)